jgi:hypothetical protein
MKQQCQTEYMTWQIHRGGSSFFPDVKLENYSIPGNGAFSAFYRTDNEQHRNLIKNN